MRFAHFFMISLVLSTSSFAAVFSPGYDIRAMEPVVCQVSQHGKFAQLGNSYSLGQLVEYCNARNGFVVEVVYQPGHLKGTALQIGDRRIVLNGSGREEVMRALGAHASVQDITAMSTTEANDLGNLVFRLSQL